MTMKDLLLYLCLLGLFQSSVKALFFNNGELKSNHSLYYVGENITLHCLKTQPFVGNVVFKARDDIVPSVYVTVVSNTYARMDRPVTADDPKSITYTCRDNVTAVIGSASILTEYRPQKAENVTPVWYDRTTATFSWDLGLDAYKFRPDNQNPNNPTTVVNASYCSDNGNWRECPPVNQLSANTSCQVDDFFWPLDFQLRVRVQNKQRGDTVDTIFNISTITNYEKPKPVQDLNETIMNSTCVKLTWYSDRSQLSGKVRYRLKKDLPGKVKEINVSEDVNHTTICDLHPAYEYTLDVFAVPRQGYPSDPVTKVLKMLEDVPASGPRVSKAGYTRGSCSSSEKQEVIVYFQSVAEEDQNGDIIRYTAEFATETWSDQFSRSPADGLYFRRDIPCGSGLNVTLYASTHIGQSPPSYLSIPRVLSVAELTEEVKRLDLQVEQKNATQVIARWKAPDPQLNYALFLYYCVEREWGVPCKDPLQYVKLNATQGSYVLDLYMPTSSLQSAQYGLAAVTMDGRQGTNIFFTDCIYSKTGNAGDPPRPPSPIAQTGSILLRWKTDRCDRNRIIWGYVIKFYPVGHQEDAKDTYTEGGDTDSHTLENLDPGTNYSIRIAANTTSNLTDFSGEVYAQPLRDSGLEPGAIVGIVLAVLTAVLLLACIVVLSVRRWWREGHAPFDFEVRKMIKKPVYGKINTNGVPPPVPGGHPVVHIGSHDTGEGNHQASRIDSGFEETTPPSSPEDKGNLAWSDTAVDVVESGNSDYVRVGQSTPAGPGAAAGNITPDGMMMNQQMVFVFTQSVAPTIQAEQQIVPPTPRVLPTPSDSHDNLSLVVTEASTAFSAQGSSSLGPYVCQTVTVADDSSPHHQHEGLRQHDSSLSASKPVLHSGCIRSDDTSLSAGKPTLHAGYVGREEQQAMVDVERSITEGGSEMQVAPPGLWTQSREDHSVGMKDVGAYVQIQQESGSLEHIKNKPGLPSSKNTYLYKNSTYLASDNNSTAYLSNNCLRDPLFADEVVTGSCDEEDEEEMYVTDEEVQQQASVNMADRTTTPTDLSGAEVKLEAQGDNLDALSQQHVDVDTDTTFPDAMGVDAGGIADDQTLSSDAGSGYVPHSALCPAAAAQEHDQAEHKTSGGYIPWTDSPDGAQWGQDTPGLDQSMLVDEDDHQDRSSACGPADDAPDTSSLVPLASATLPQNVQPGPGEKKGYVSRDALQPGPGENRGYVYCDALQPGPRENMGYMSSDALQQMTEGEYTSANFSSPLTNPSPAAHQANSKADGDVLDNGSEPSSPHEQNNARNDRNISRNRADSGYKSETGIHLSWPDTQASQNDKDVQVDASPLSVQSPASGYIQFAPEQLTQDVPRSNVLSIRL